MFFAKNSMSRKHLMMIVLKTFSWKSFITHWKHLCENMSLKCFQNDYSIVEKTSHDDCLENVFLEIIHILLKMSLWKHVFKMFSKRLFNVKKMPHDDCLENVFLEIIHNLLKASSWKYLFKMLSKHFFEDI